IVTGGSDDPMQVLRMDGEAVASDPLVLADEANSMSMFGGKRAIRLRAGTLRGGTKSLIPALTPLVATPPQDSVVIIEAGDLKKSDPLVTLFRSAQRTASMVCYLDNNRNVSDLIDQAVRDARKTIDAEARALLAGLCGGDRIATRGEIEKLLLYAGSDARITVAHVESSAGDTAMAVTESAVDGAFAGDLKVMMMALERLKAEGNDAGVLLGFALRHGWRLMQVLNGLQAKKNPPPDLWKQVTPFFPRKALVERQLMAWSPELLGRQLRTLGDSIATVRATPKLAESTLDRTLLGIALAARRAR
ncbi:MAG: DNA polymerase III subunit delta, partial [Beijerinckiaceae bacterium]